MFPLDLGDPLQLVPILSIYSHAATYIFLLAYVIHLILPPVVLSRQLSSSSICHIAANPKFVKGRRQNFLWPQLSTYSHEKQLHSL